MADSLAFYRRLGLVVPPSEDGESHVELTFTGWRLIIDTEDVVRSYDPDWTRATGGSGTLSLTFTAGSPAEVDATWDDLTGHGYRARVAPFDAPWGSRHAIVLDPDGTAVHLSAPLAG